METGREFSRHSWYAEISTNYTTVVGIVNAHVYDTPVYYSIMVCVCVCVCVCARAR